jgi:hypothetical protein
MPADHRQAQYGPADSWPNGYPALQYPDGDYRYPAQPGTQPYAGQAPASQDGHPYAAFGGDPYGNGGYESPDPASQGGYPGGAIEAYPAPVAPEALAAPGAPESGHIYSQPWDYDQPLRYEGEEPAYPLLDSAGQSTYSPPSYDAAGSYNRSQYSTPGFSGNAYDLSGIIGTSDFPEIGYDQPSYGRLSYDDPRYDDAPRSQTRFDMPSLDSFDSGSRAGDSYPGVPGASRADSFGNGSFDGGSFNSGSFDGGPPHSETRFDMPALDAFDESRLDHVWPARENIPDERSGFVDRGMRTMDTGAQPVLFADTHTDMPAVPDRYSATRFDMPAVSDSGSFAAFDTSAPQRLDQTSVDGMRALAPSTEFRSAGTGLLSHPDDQDMNWASETSLDSFGALDTAEAPAGFGGPEAMPAEELASPRKNGKRRGRSSDKRQWIALGCIAVAAAGAITGVLMKTVFAGPNGPAHTVTAASKVDPYTREASLEKQMNVNSLRDTVVKDTGGQASNVVSAVYEQTSSVSGSDPQVFMFVGGNLANSDPAASVTAVEKNGAARAVAPGSLGGQAACGMETVNGQSVSMCVWFDNDTFGDMVSPSMTPTQLATTLTKVRPDLEHVSE